MSLSETLNSVNSKSCSIEIFGLGYVGFPLAIRLASTGLNIIGIDVNSQRINRLQNNKLMDLEIHLKNEFLECRKKTIFRFLMNHRIRLIQR